MICVRCYKEAPCSVGPLLCNECSRKSDALEREADDVRLARIERKLDAVLRMMAVDPDAVA